MGETLRQLVAELDDRQFEHVYGPVARLRPGDAAALLQGFERPWWIVGGWAIEVFTGVERAHDDLDLSVLACDVPAVVEHFVDTHHVWAAGAGMLCPLLSADQELPSWLSQLWVRDDSSGPWLLDVIVAPDLDGKWVCQRDPEFVEHLERVTWVADDGITYQSPQITLAFKVALDRPKDRADLAAAGPLLDDDALAWLAGFIGRRYPEHDWLDLPPLRP